MNSFEKALRGTLNSNDWHCRVLLREFDGLQGRADLIDARIRALPKTVSLGSLAMALRSPTKARLLAILRHRAPRRRDYIRKATGLTDQTLERHIHHLEKVGLVQVHRSSSVSLACPLPWSMVDIVAYEGKLHDWRRALHQAMGYRGFSHSVSVLMPTSVAQRAKKLANIFQINGIGLMAVAEDGSTKTIIRSRRRRPASRRLYLMAVGMVIDHFMKEGKYHTDASDLNLSSASNHCSRCPGPVSVAKGTRGPNCE